MSEKENNDIENTSEDIVPEAENNIGENEEFTTDTQPIDEADIQGDDTDIYDDYDEEDISVTDEVQELPDYDEIDEPDVEGFRRRAQEKERSRKKLRLSKQAKKTISVAAVAVAVTMTVIYIIGIITVPQNTVMRNVYIEKVNLGGMTYDEVLKRLTQEYLLNDISIPISSGGRGFIIRGAEIGMTANPEDTAKRVFNYGKSGNKFADGFKNALCIFKRHRIMPAAKTDRTLLEKKINEFGISLYGEMAEHFVKINEEYKVAEVHPGHTGYNPNDPNSYTEAADLILSAIDGNRSGTIYIRLSESKPKELTIDMLDGAVYADPVDAKYSVKDNEVVIEPEKNGRYLDKEEAAAYLPYVYEGGEVIKIPYYTSYASITSDTLNSRLFADNIGSFSTSYRGSTSNRAANVARAASLINGKVLAPDDIFSFNDTVGSRTAANGFFTATEYVNGESVQGIGGGTCQVSTTLYCAVLYADLQIVHRENHVMTVGYVPLGQDATVADGSIDFKFKNTTKYPIKITTHTDGGTIYVDIWGTAWNPARRVELKHDVSEVGEDTIVKSTRYVYENDALISTDSLGQSYYKPHKTPSPTAAAVRAAAPAAPVAEPAVSESSAEEAVE